MPQRASTRRTQAERTTSMRMRLIGATIESLVERGYAHTTAVEVCRRAGVTRGALLHHFEDLSALFEASLEWLYQDIGRSSVDATPDCRRAGRQAVHRADVVGGRSRRISRRRSRSGWRRATTRRSRSACRRRSSAWAQR